MGGAECSVEVSAVPGVDVRENMLEAVGAGVVVTVEGVGGAGGGGGGGGGGGAAVALALAGVLSFESSHCDGEPSPGEPTSTERTGAVAGDGADADACELWARRCGRRMLSRGIVAAV